MIAITGEIANRDFGIGNAGLDQLFDIVGIHRHGARPPCRQNPIRLNPTLGWNAGPRTVARALSESPDVRKEPIPIPAWKFAARKTSVAASALARRGGIGSDNPISLRGVRCLAFVTGSCSAGFACCCQPLVLSRSQLRSSRTHCAATAALTSCRTVRA